VSKAVAQLGSGNAIPNPCPHRSPFTVLPLTPFSLTVLPQSSPTFSSLKFRNRILSLHARAEFAVGRSGTSGCLGVDVDQDCGKLISQQSCTTHRLGIRRGRLSTGFDQLTVKVSVRSWLRAEDPEPMVPVTVSV
jgi:hypothetical protein